MEEEFVKKIATSFMIGSDVSTLSIAEIEEVIANLHIEIQRLTEIQAKKQVQKSAAENLFRAS